MTTANNTNVDTAVIRWAARHNTEQDRNPQRCITRYNREEAGLKVTGHSTLHYDRNGELDAVSVHTLAEFNGETVFEKAGGTVLIFLPGDWMKILTTHTVRQESIIQATPVDIRGGIMRQIMHWVAQHNRRDEGDHRTGSHMFFDREEQGLKVVDHSVFYSGDDGVGTHTVATFNGITVFEQAGLKVKICIPGDWMKIVATA